LSPGGGELWFPTHRGQGELARRSFGIVIHPFILRLKFYIDGASTTRRFSTKVFTLATVTGVCELSLVCVTLHGKVNVLLKDSNDAIDEYHNNFYAPNLYPS